MSESVQPHPRESLVLHDAPVFIGDRETETSNIEKKVASGKSAAQIDDILKATIPPEYVQCEILMALRLRPDTKDLILIIVEHGQTRVDHGSAIHLQHQRRVWMS